MVLWHFHTFFSPAVSASSWLWVRTTVEKYHQSSAVLFRLTIALHFVLADFVFSSLLDPCVGCNTLISSIMRRTKAKECIKNGTPCMIQEFFPPRTSRGIPALFCSMSASWYTSFPARSRTQLPKNRRCKTRAPPALTRRPYPWPARRRQASLSPPRGLRRAGLSWPDLPPPLSIGCRSCHCGF